MKTSSHDYCHSSVDLVMSCDGCQLLWPIPVMISQVAGVLTQHKHQSPRIRRAMAAIFRGRPAAEIYRERQGIARRLGQELQLDNEAEWMVEDAIHNYCGCLLEQCGPEAAVARGCAGAMDEPVFYPGVMAQAAGWGPPTGEEIIAKPGLAGLRRLILISDAGDALVRGVSYEYLDEEIIGTVTSSAGREHIWLWHSRWPSRMAAFAEWLIAHGGHWPSNLVAMTSMWCYENNRHLQALRQIPGPVKALRLRMDWPKPDLDGVNWVIGQDATCGGAAALWEDCNRRNLPLFLSGVGRFSDEELAFWNNRLGNDPDALRLWRFPTAFFDVGARS